MLTTVTGDGLALNHAAISGVTTVIMHRVGIQLLAPASRLVDAETVVVPRHRREVAGDDDFITGFIAAHEDKYRTLMIVDHQPFEAVGIEIKFMQRFMVAVGMVQVAHQPLDAVVPVVATLQQMPVETGVVVPLAAPGELLPINSSFLPGKANSQP